MYDYRIAEVARVVDGDTFDLDVGLGFYIQVRIRVRLKDIDTPEVYGRNVDPVRGPAASEAAREWFDRVDSPGIRTEKANWRTPVARGGFGRWLGEVYDMDTGELLADWLRAEGHEK